MSGTTPIRWNDAAHLAVLAACVTAPAQADQGAGVIVVRHAPRQGYSVLLKRMPRAPLWLLEYPTRLSSQAHKLPMHATRYDQSNPVYCRRLEITLRMFALLSDPSSDIAFEVFHWLEDRYHVDTRERLREDARTRPARARASAQTQAAHRRRKAAIES